jgi:hypothetical protein
MKQRPIIFSGEMVRAILDGRKTQTRRVANQDFRMQKAIRIVTNIKADYFDFIFADETGMIRKCPYGLPGDQLWVRESFRELIDLGEGTNSSRSSIKRTNPDSDFNPDVKWKLHPHATWREYHLAVVMFEGDCRKFHRWMQRMKDVLLYTIR